jgi:hypothetical protein
VAYRVARLAAVLACVVAVGYAVYFLFGPTYMTCSTGTIGSGHPSATFAPASCHSANFFEANGGGPLGAEQLVRPLFFVGLWTLAPFVGLGGVVLRRRGHLAAIGLIGLAVLIDATSIISWGGFYYAMLCMPLLAIALLATLAMGW